MNDLLPRDVPVSPDVTLVFDGAGVSGGHTPSIVAPLAEWLSRNGRVVRFSTPEEASESAGIRMWVDKDDSFEDREPADNDYALAACAREGWKVMHPAVSISKLVRDPSLFDTCYWMVESEDTKKKLLQLIQSEGEQEKVETILVIESAEHRVIYHNALCLVTAEVYTNFEVARLLLTKAEFGDSVWRAVRDTGMTSIRHYQDGHYHGPAARGDRVTLRKHIDVLRKYLPSTIPFYLEHIQVRIAEKARVGRHDALGLNEQLWEDRSSQFKFREDQDHVDSGDAKLLLEELNKHSPSKLLLISVTFFELQLNSYGNLEVVSRGDKIEGDSFIYYCDSTIKSAFQRQIDYFHGQSKGRSVTKRILESEVGSDGEVKPFIVVAGDLAHRFRGSPDFYVIETTPMPGSDERSQLLATEKWKFTSVKITADQDDTVEVSAGHGSDGDGGKSDGYGWFPTHFANVAELIIPIFRYSSERRNPLLEGLVTLVGDVDEISYFTPGRIADIKSLAGWRYLAMGHWERKIVEAATAKSELEITEKVKGDMWEHFKAENISESLEGVSRFINTIGNFLYPPRLLNEPEALRKYIDVFHKIAVDKHDLSDWTGEDVDRLKREWASGSDDIRASVGKSTIGDNNLYNAFFTDSAEDVSCNIHYILKALHQGNCPLIWVCDRNYYKWQVKLKRITPPFSWANVVRFISSTNNSMKDIKCDLNLNINEGTLQIEVTVSPNHHRDGYLGLSRLYESYVDKVKSRKIEGFSREQTSSVLAFLGIGTLMWERDVKVSDSHEIYTFKYIIKEIQ